MGILSMIDISTFYIFMALEPLIQTYRLYKLPSRVMRIWYLLVRAYQFIVNREFILILILDLINVQWTSPMKKTHLINVQWSKIKIQYLKLQNQYQTQSDLKSDSDTTEKLRADIKV